MVCIQRSAGHHASIYSSTKFLLFSYFLSYLSVVCFRISFVSIPASVFVFSSRSGVDLFFFIHFAMFNLAYFCGSVLGAA